MSSVQSVSASMMRPKMPDLQGAFTGAAERGVVALAIAGGKTVEQDGAVVNSNSGHHSAACWLEDYRGETVENGERTDRTKSIADAIAESSTTEYVPVTFENCDHIEGPFFHGTRAAFDVGDEIDPGHGSNYHDGRIANHVYFAALLEPAIWGAELAVALGGGDGRERIYVVEPLGSFEDDPNVTNKKFPGNVTQSYRTRHPMRVVGEVETWDSHPPEVVHGMLDRIARLRADGLDVIED